MNVEIKGNVCIVRREEGDPKFSGIVNGAGESRLLYHVKNILNKQGYDLIKKRMHKDGHLVDDMQQYLRTRTKGKEQPVLMIYNDCWQIEGADEIFNRRGEVRLVVIETPRYAGTNIFIGYFRKRFVPVVADGDGVGELWANEYFKIKQELIDFVKQNQMILTSDEVIEWDKVSKTAADKPIFKVPQFK